jgi:hypothetical protein
LGSTEAFANQIRRAID